MVMHSSALLESYRPTGEHERAQEGAPAPRGTARLYLATDPILRCNSDKSGSISHAGRSTRRPRAGKARGKYDRSPQRDGADDVPWGERERVPIHRQHVDGIQKSPTPDDANEHGGRRCKKFSGFGASGRRVVQASFFHAVPIFRPLALEDPDGRAWNLRMEP
ncbi:hypothetical protein C8F04DRAFT_1184324 [Mycena alexandri]|uniref:Uncharacterized protein n=1 Tax=Mycena alexandri TaxID=1745969 RepID=A0AAD6SX13_9AGAR|nr:hypothetical protein C8F04DRAFT_1184324 [Mycena alexandri]